MAKKLTGKDVKLECKEGFFTYDDGGRTYCLGYLVHFEGKGTFDAALGKVDVTKEQADAHNKLYEKAELKGLRTCDLGLSGHLFYDEAKREIHTFLGSKVETRHITVRGKVITFSIVMDEEKFHSAVGTFRGRLPKDSEGFFFKRIA